MMHGNGLKLFGAALVALLLAATASAGPLPAGPLPGDTAAMVGFHGISTMYSSGPVSGVTLNAYVEYAVYDKGKIQTSGVLGATPGVLDPSNGNDYVYTYEIFNDASSTAGEYVKDLTLHLDPPAVPVGSLMRGNSTATPEGGIAPNQSRFSPTSGSSPTSVLWVYTSTLTLLPGTHSDILYFTSPFAPTWAISNLDGKSVGGLAVITNSLNLPSPSNLPSPTPEPGTAVLAAIAAICLLAGRRLRMRSLAR